MSGDFPFVQPTGDFDLVECPICHMWYNRNTYHLCGAVANPPPWQPFQPYEQPYNPMPAPVTPSFPSIPVFPNGALSPYQLDQIRVVIREEIERALQKKKNL